MWGFKDGLGETERLVGITIECGECRTKHEDGLFQCPFMEIDAACTCCPSCRRKCLTYKYVKDGRESGADVL